MRRCKPTSENCDVKKKKVQKKARNGYQLPDPIEKGEIVTDVYKKQWKIGNSIGVGGFGEIYLAYDDISRPLDSHAKYVIKIEPHENGPLFSEMHFYLRVAKEELIDTWISNKKLKFLGMPKFIASGSHEYKGTKYRFMVMERFGDDLQKMFEARKKNFSLKTIFSLGIKILDVLEYIHSHGYVHADIKGSNLLLGYEDELGEKVYLVDFGLASRYLSSNGMHKEYKEDPRKAHDGTIEFTSRDAHIGAHSRRGDLEILGYNMLQWSCGKLPWETDLKNQNKVKEMKNQYLNNIPKLMEDCYKNSSVIPAIQRYFEYIITLNFDEEPNYDKCRQILQEGLKQARLKNDGKLGLNDKPTYEQKTSRVKETKRKAEVKEGEKVNVNPLRKRREVSRTSSRLNQMEISDPDDSNETFGLYKPTPEMLKVMQAKRQRLHALEPNQRKKALSGPSIVVAQRRRIRVPVRRRYRSQDVGGDGEALRKRRITRSNQNRSRRLASHGLRVTRSNPGMRNIDHHSRTTEEMVQQRTRD